MGWVGTRVGAPEDPLKTSDSAPLLQPSRPDASLVPARRGGGISKEAAAEAAWSRDAFPAAAPSEAARRK